MTQFNRKYVVHGEDKATKEYKEVELWSTTSKQAYIDATAKYPDIKFVEARVRGCNCGK